MTETMTTDRKRLAKGIAFDLAIVAVVMLGWFVLQQANAIESPDLGEFMTVTDNEVLIVIPEGTNERISNGYAPVFIHGDIVLTIGETDRLTIRNEDDVPHSVGFFYVDSGQSVSQRFTQPDIYEAVCTFQEEGVRIVVQEPVQS